LRGPARSVSRSPNWLLTDVIEEYVQARIFTDASGEVRVVPNPDYERVEAVRADHARRGNERRNLPSVRRHHPRRDTMKESLHLLFKSLHEDASLARGDHDIAAG